ncbi:MAG TPA: CARDB domain-containing protein [Polyangiaceae bacterium]
MRLADVYFQAVNRLCKAWLVCALLTTSACAPDVRDSCNPGDQNGFVGGINTVKVSVSDTAFAVGGVGSDSTEPNIAVENTSTVTLTVTNTGTKPHGFKVACIPSGLPAGCAQMSCFPDAANIPAIAPGDSVTVTFSTPALEGVYRFFSDEDGDSSVGGEGNETGLVGEFVLM